MITKKKIKVTGIISFISLILLLFITGSFLYSLILSIFIFCCFLFFQSDTGKEMARRSREKQRELDKEQKELHFAKRLGYASELGRQQARDDYDNNPFIRRK